jgi:hypothetical protein
MILSPEPYLPPREWNSHSSRTADQGPTIPHWNKAYEFMVRGVPGCEV